MPRASRPAHFKIFISSPGDVAEERRIALDVLQQIPREPAWKGVVTIESVAYDDPHAGIALDAGLPPQQSVERRERASACDLTIVILWGRMGTAVEAPRRPDGSQYASGTEREFEDAKSAGKPILLYRRSSAPQVAIDDEAFDEKRRQWTLVKAFFERMKNADGTWQGGFHTYDTVEEFRTLLKQHVEGELRRLLESTRQESSSQEIRSTLRPDTPPPIPPAYLAWLKERCASVELLGLRLKHGQAVRLNNVYVPLVTTEVVERQTGSEEKGALESVEDETLLLDRLGRESIYVAGDPGSGKSTFCRWVAWLACEGAIPHHDVEAPDAFREELSASLIGRLPILVPLRDLWSVFPDPARASALSIREFTDILSGWLADRRAPDVTPEQVAAHFERGTALLILDGLDEVPQRQRTLLLHTLADARAAWARQGNRLVVTSRPYGLSTNDVRRLGLPQAPIVASPYPLQVLLVRRWFRILSETAAGADAAADELLRQAQQQSWLMPLMANPLLLTAMCIIFGEGKRLPEDKYELYDRVVDTVLHSRIPERARLQLVRARLSVIAHAMHTGEAIDESPRLTPQAIITDAEIDRALRAYQERSGWTEQHVRGALEDRDELVGQTGLLLPRELHQAAFFHLSIQEFLAAQRIGDVDAERIRDVFCERSARPEWRNTLSFLFGNLLATNTTPERGVRVLSDLIQRTTDESAGLRLVAADCVEILTRRRIALPSDLERHLAKGLVHTMRQAPDARTRCDAGTALGRVGDPRFRADMWFLPDDESLGFVTISQGPFTMGSRVDDQLSDSDERPQHEVTLPTFYIAKWPTTVAQFKAFVEDADNEGVMPGDGECVRSVSNHPIVRVSWGEVLAYCRWLTRKLRASSKTPGLLRAALLGKNGPLCQVTLPSEAEWEKAARATDARVFPWGSGVSPNRANYINTGIGGPSAVGSFPEGAREAVEELSGNVYEWTRSAWRFEGEANARRYPYQPDYHARDGESITRTALYRVKRGGAFTNESRAIRAAYRSPAEPTHRSPMVGFRVVISPFDPA